MHSLPALALLDPARMMIRIGKKPHRPATFGKGHGTGESSRRNAVLNHFYTNRNLRYHRFTSLVLPKVLARYPLGTQSADAVHQRDVSVSSLTRRLGTVRFLRTLKILRCCMSSQSVNSG